MSRRSNEKAPAVRSGAPLSLQSECRPAGLNDRWLVPGVCLFLAAITLAVFGQTVHHGFVDYDDNRYVYENALVAKGLTLNGIAQAFTHGNYDNWNPLTAISHMLDCQFYGLSPGGHHLTNILLHTATAILLFLVLRRMTGFLWRSAFVAAVFAIHPLRVESVAWVAERKDVLSGLFFMLTIGAYVRYVHHSWQLSRYLTVVVLFALGLMSKPMLVTLPFVLLLLDYWPLNRFNRPALAAEGAGPVDGPGHFSVPLQLIIEKIPLLVLSVPLCVATVLVDRTGIGSVETFPLHLRIGNALISYATYICQMFYPARLATLYSYPTQGVPVWKIIMAVLVLASISAGVFFWRRTRPYLLVGWLWYLGMLVPVIGVVQVGAQARADRYTYLPQIGLYMLLTWAAADLCAGWRHRRMVLGGLSTVILAALMFCAHTQVSYWRNSETLWTHTLACTSDNFIGQNNLGNALLRRGRMDEAIAHYRKALQIKSDYGDANFDLGDALLQKGSVDEAIPQFQKALQIIPDYAEAHFDLGNALLQKGSVDEAIAHFQRALQIKPDYAEAHVNLGFTLFTMGNVDEAIAHFQKALQINPDYAEAHVNLGIALLKSGNVDEAIAHFQKALQIKPDYAEAQNDLAWVLAACPQASLRNGNKAVELALRANQLTDNGNPIFLGTLAAAYAEAGRFPEAVATAQRALQLAGTQSNTALANAIQSQIKLYQAGIPFHLQ
jgi:tetratricopeptide (TPR) repeat protein